MKEKFKNPIIQQYVLEIALPIVGYFFFDWSITIIAVFYLIDYFCAEIARNRRVFKVYKNTKNAKQNGFVFSMFFGASLFALAFAFTYLNFELRYAKNLQAMYAELLEFAKDELWFLLPVVYLVYHLKDVMTFYAPRRFLKRDYKKMVKYQIMEMTILVVLILFGVFCWRYFQLNDIVAIFSFIIIKIGFDILVARTLDAKYKTN